MLRRTMLVAAWGHLALTALFVLVMASGRGSASTRVFTLFFLVMAFVSFRLARRMRTGAYWKVPDHA